VIISGYTMVIAFEFWRGRAEPLGSRWPAIIVLGAHSALFLLRVPSRSRLHKRIGLDLGNGLVRDHRDGVTCFTPLPSRSSWWPWRRSAWSLKQKKSALSDSLTGIANRRAFFDEAVKRLDPGGKRRNARSRFSSSISTASRGSTTGFGHAVGDKVLRLFAEKATANLRPADLVGRLGGEEFAVILSGVELSTAFMMAEQIRIAFAAASRLVDGHRVLATTSAVIALPQTPRKRTSTACSRVQIRRFMFAKARGRDRVEIAEVDRPRAWRPAEAKRNGARPLRPRVGAKPRRCRRAKSCRIRKVGIH